MKQVDFARKAVVITPSDTVDIDPIPFRLYVGTGGDLDVILIDDTVAVTFKNVQSGAILNIRAKRVLTSSSADDIVALY